MARYHAFPLICCLIFGSGFACSQTAESEFEKGMVALHSGRQDVAIIHFKNTLQANPDYLPAKTHLGRLLVDSGQLTLAKNLLDESLKDGADSDTVAPLMMEIVSKQGDVDAGRILLSRFPNLQENIDALYWYSVLLTSNYLKSDAKALLDRLLKQNVSDPRIAFERAKIAIADGDRGLVNDLVSQLQTMDNNTKYVALLRGMDAMQNSLYKDAVEQFEHVIRTDENNATALFSLALIKSELAQPDQALAHITHLRELQPQNTMAQLLHALILASTQQKSESQKLIDDLKYQLSQVDSSHFSSYHSYMASALLYRLQGDYSQALKYVQRFLKHTQNSPEAESLLGELLLLKGNSTEATAHLSKLVQRKTASPQDYENLGRAYLQTKQYGQYANTINQGYIAYPHFQPIALRKASLLLAEGMRDEAISLLELHQFSYHDSQQDITLARLYLQLSHTDTAKVISQVLANYPLLWSAHQVAGEFSLAKGDIQEAKQFFTQAHQLSPDSPEPVLFLASLAKNEGDNEALKMWLTKAESLSPANVIVIGLLADQYLSDNNLESALPYLQKLYNADKTSEHAIALLTAYLNTGRVNDARRLLQEAVTRDKLAAGLIYFQWQFAMRDRRFNDALHYLRLLADIYYDDATKLAAIVEYQLQLNNVIVDNRQQLDDEIRGALTRLKTIAPSAEQVEVLTARYHFSRKDYDQALQDIDAISSRGAQFVKFQVFLARQEYDLALPIIRSLYAQYPVQYWQPYANLLMEEGDKNTLQQLLLEQLERKPDDINTRLLYAVLLDSLRQSDAAEQTLLEGLTLGVSPVLHNQLANHYLNSNRIVLALQHARQAFDLQPDNPAFGDTLGWAMVNNGQAEEALAFLRAAYAKASTHPAVNYHLGMALVSTGRQNEALPYLQVAANSTKSDSAVSLAATALDRIQNNPD